ncbi:Ger(x)C family spore germination protein [Chungangia koreensis]|uniref:Ger(X)C family spore germination protein n=1 Tax=Chungangia koreensis TaxID=752657 RepID=A0ABV8X5D5_9LACT
MIHRIGLAFLLLCLLPILTSCWDLNEPNRMLYVYGMGIDYKNDKYEIYVQLIDFANIARSEQPNPEAVQTEIGRGTGESIDQAIFNLYETTDIKMFWGHLTYIVFSEESLKKEKANTVIDKLLRYYETRYQIWVYTTKESVQEILLLNPIFNKSMSIYRLADPYNSFDQNSLVEPMDLRKLIIGLDEPGHEVVVPNVKIEENWKTEDEGDKAPKIGSVSILSPNGIRGSFEKDEIRGLRWISDETKRGDISVETDSGLLTILLNKPKIDIKPIVKGKDITFNIKVKANATVSSLESSVSDQEVIDRAKKKIESEIKSTFATALEKDVDIYRLSEVLYRDHVKVWKDIQKDGKIPLSKDSINTITVEIEKVISSRKENVKTIR